jgi:hypothetical protein
MSVGTNMTSSSSIIKSSSEDTTITERTEVLEGEENVVNTVL